eukprot:13162743-Alexandrium_andersonii.AAC.1
MWAVRCAPRCPAAAGRAAAIVAALAGRFAGPPQLRGRLRVALGKLHRQAQADLGMTGPALPWEDPHARRVLAAAILALPGDLQGPPLGRAAARKAAPLVLSLIHI